MPNIFSDTFDRANGSLGASWAVGGNFAIVGNAAVGSSYSSARLLGVSQSGDQDASIVLNSADGASAQGSILLKANSDASHFYFVVCSIASGSGHIELHRWDGSSDSTYVGDSIAVPSDTDCIFRATYVSGVLHGYINGSERVYHADSSYSTQATYGLQARNTTSTIRAFWVGSPPVLSFDVLPSPVGNFGTPTDMTAFEVASAWTAGTPGTPAIAVDHGTISGQVVIDAHHATFTYDPGLFLGSATFTDPSTGAICVVTVTSDVTVVNPGIGQLSSTILAYLQRSADAEPNATIANREMVISESGPSITFQNGVGSIRLATVDTTYAPGGNPAVSALAYTLWQLINGSTDPAFGPWLHSDGIPISEKLWTLSDTLSTMQTSNGWTLGDVITQITGLGVPTIKDVMDSLGSITAPDLSGVTDRLDAMRGDGTTSLYTLLSSLAGIRTVDALSLGDVMDALDHVGGSSPVPTALAVTGLIAALALAAPTGGASVAAAALAVGAGPVLDIATIVELVSVLGELASIASDVASIKAQPSASYLGAPVWPGASLVDLGTSVSLGSRGTITEAMDGVVVDIDHADADHKPAYSYDGALAWRNIGCLAFADDQGRLEGYQPFCFANQIFTPKSLRRAASVRWFTGHGPIGTIRTWVAKS